MDSTSLAYREGRFAEIFEAARSNRLREDEKIAYSQSLEKLRDTQAGIRFAADRAREEGRAEGEAKGRAEGVASVAVNLLRQGMDIEIIANATGLSVERIRELNCY